MYARTRTHVRINIFIIEKNKIFPARARGKRENGKRQKRKLNMIQLRPYQEHAVRSIVRYVHDGGTLGLVVLPTGAGKSYVIAFAARDIGGRVLVLCPSKEILEQNYNKFRSEVPDVPCSMFSASVGMKEISTVTFATIGSIVRRPQDFTAFRVIIIDEAHKVGDEDATEASMYQDFLAHLPKAQVIGLTATPFRLQSKTNMFYDCSKRAYQVRTVSAKMISLVGRQGYFDKVISVAQVADLCSRGWLAAPIYPRCHYGPHTDQMLDNTLRHLCSPNHKTIVFTRSVTEAKELADRYLAIGLPVGYVSAKMGLKRRTEVIESFRRGDIRMMFNRKVLEIGYDDPSIDSVVLLSTTHSLNSYYQMVGRAIRPYPGKCATVYDFGWTSRTFGNVADLQYRTDSQGQWQMYSGSRQLTDIELIKQQ